MRPEVVDARDSRLVAEASRLGIVDHGAGAAIRLARGHFTRRPVSQNKHTRVAFESSSSEDAVDA